MLRYSASDTIAASPEEIWEILTDAPAYPEWDPYCEKIEGRIGPGEKIRAFTTLSPGRAFPVRVSTFQPPRLMVWTGGMPFGLFRGERTFRLTPEEKGSTRVEVEEVFSGPLLGMIRKSLPDMTEPFAAFIAGLKKRAEAR